MLDEKKPEVFVKNFADAGYREAAIANEFPAEIKKTVSKTASGETVLIHKSGDFTRVTGGKVSEFESDEILPSPFSVKTVDYMGVGRGIQNPDWFPANVEPSSELFSYDGTEFIVVKKPVCFQGTLKNKKKLRMFFSSESVKASDVATWFNSAATSGPAYQFIESDYELRTYHPTTVMYKPKIGYVSGGYGEKGVYIDELWFSIRRVKSFSFKYKKSNFTYTLSADPGDPPFVVAAGGMNKSSVEGVAFNREYLDSGKKLKSIVLGGGRSKPKIILPELDGEFFAMGNAKDSNNLMAATTPPVSYGDYSGANGSYRDIHLQETVGFGKVFHGLLRLENNQGVLKSDTGVGPPIITGESPSRLKPIPNLLYSFGLPAPDTPQVIKDKGGLYRNYSVLPPAGGFGRELPTKKFIHRALYRDDSGKVFNVRVSAEIANLVPFSPQSANFKSCDITFNFEMLGRSGSVGENTAGIYESFNILSVTRSVTLAKFDSEISDPPFYFKGATGWAKLDDLALEVYNTPNCRKIMATVGIPKGDLGLVNIAILCEEVSISGTWPDLVVEHLARHVSSNDSATVRHRAVRAASSIPGDGITVSSTTVTESSVTTCYMPSEDNTFKRVNQKVNLTISNAGIDQITTTRKGMVSVNIGDKGFEVPISDTSTHNKQMGEWSYPLPDFAGFNRRGHLVMDLYEKMVGVDGGEFVFSTGFGSGTGDFAYNPKTHEFATPTYIGEIIYFV